MSGELQSHLALLGSHQCGLVLERVSVCVVCASDGVRRVGGVFASHSELVSSPLPAYPPLSVCVFVFGAFGCL